jgi:UDP-glucuronate decarboxylase
MKCLVTGGAGFIGSFLCERLIADGAEVVCQDNLFTGRYENVEHLNKTTKFSFLKLDVVEGVPQEKFDWIFNLACPASPPHYQSDPVYTAETSFIGASNVLKLATKTGSRVFQASTSEVYGDPKVRPQPEEYWGNVNCNGVRSCYDEGKRIAETLFCDYHRKFGTDIRIVRIFNTYGPRMRPDDGRVVSNFICQALAGKDITIYGDGTQTRSFCYVDDTVDGFIRLMKSNVKNPVNIGNPDEFTMLELANVVLRITNSKSKIKFVSLPQDDPKFRRPDISKARRELGWCPKVLLNEGIEKTANYFKTMKLIK